MTWREASVGSWPRSFGIALASAVCLAAPATAQLARIQASPNAPKAIVVPFGRVTPGDSDIATEIADAFRDRMRVAHGEDFNVIPKAAMCAALEQSGFGCSSELEPTQVGQLANVMNARFIVDGRLFPHGDSLLVLVRLVQAIRSNPMGTAASISVARSSLRASIGAQLADRIAEKFRSFEYITACKNQRELKNYPRAMDAATRALRYDPQSGGAYLCMALTLQEQGASTDTVQVTLERAHDADSLNTTVARQLAFIYQEKHDTTSLMHMLHHIVQVDINDNDLRKSYAQLFVLRGHPDSAVMILNQALVRNPNQWDLLNVKAISFGAWQKWDSASAVMAQAADLDSTKIDSTFVDRILSFYDAGRDSVRALEWVRRGTQKVPTWANLWYRYATMLLARNDTTGSLAATKQFMTLAPSDGRGHLVYATLLQATGQVDSALAHAKMAGDADSNYRAAAAGIYLRAGVVALQAQNWPRADSLLTIAKQWAQGQAQQTATFWAGVAEFQRGYAALTDAQKRQGPRVDQVQRDSGCASVRLATDFLNQAEQNITPNVAVNRETASQLLTYLPQLKTALPQMARNLKCPS